MTIHIRPFHRNDRDRVLRFYRRLSPETLQSRFFDVCSPERAVESTPVDRCFNHDGVVADAGGEIVGVAQYFLLRNDRNAVEVAIAVADECQGHRIGTQLLERLILVAAVHGIRRFEAEVLLENERMLHVFFRLGFEVRAKTNNVVELSLDLTPWTAVA